MNDALKPLRKYIQPKIGDNWETIAARVFPNDPQDKVIENLKSWNLFLAFRPTPMITPSDIMFVEPPAQQ